MYVLKSLTNFMYTFCLYAYFVCSARAIIPAASGVEKDVPRNPVTQEDDKDVDV